MKQQDTGAPSLRASVIVPAYNARDHIRQCLDSLRAQTVTEFEVLVVDDGSTDDTARLVRAAAAEDPRIRLLSQDNAGVSAARNAGIAASGAPWLMFVDADDLVAPDFLARLLALSDDPDCDLAVVGLRPFWGDPGLVVPAPPALTRVVERPGMLAALLGECRGFLWNKAYRASIVREQGLRLREDVSLSEDMLFNLDYLDHARRLVLDEGPCYLYRQHASSATGSLTNTRWFDVLTVFDAVRAAARDEDTRRAVARSYLPIAYEGLYRFRRLRLTDPELAERLAAMRSFCETSLRGAGARHRLRMLVSRHAMGLVLRRRRGGLRWTRG